MMYIIIYEIINCKEVNYMYKLIHSTNINLGNMLYKNVIYSQLMIKLVTFLTMVDLGSDIFYYLIYIYN